MKYFLPIYILFLAFALFALIRSQMHIDRLTAKLHETNEIIAQSEREAAERHVDEAVKIDAIRDSVYRGRVRAQEEFRDLVQAAPLDSQIFVRLDSCVQVGAIVLRELSLCDSARMQVDSALLQMRSVVTQVDSALVKERVKSARFKRQRNAAIGAAAFVTILIFAR